MHAVIIHGWKEETTDLVQALAAALGMMAYEMRQRMIGGGPAVVANFADPEKARTMAAKLNQSGVGAFIIDVDAVRGNAGSFVVRRFELKERSFRIEASDGQCAEIAYEDVDLILPGTRIRGQSETKRLQSASSASAGPFFPAAYR